MSKPSRRALLPVAILAAAVDVLTKTWVFSEIRYGDKHPVIPGFFVLRPHFNPAGPWSWDLGLPTETLRWFFPLLSLAAVGLLVRIMVTTDPADRVKAWGFALILGGAAGNLWDRAHAALDPAGCGGVRDFLYFPTIVFGRDFPAFNLADTWITIGVAMVAWRFLREKPSPAAPAPAAGSPDEAPA